MKPCSYLHIADLHLDSPFKGLTRVSPYIGDRISKSTFKALNHFVELALSVKVDFVVMSGDIFDVRDRSLRAQIDLHKALQVLSEHSIPVCIVHGNHDPENGRRAQLTWPEGVHFFASTHVETIDIVKPDRGLIAQVHGISYKTSVVKDNLALTFQRGSQPVWQVGVLHANVDGDSEHETYAPCTKQDLIQRGLDYWALGHVHTRKILHEQPYIVYPGNMQGRSIRECGAKGCYHVQVDENQRCQLTFHELDQVRWAHVSLSIAPLQNEQQLRDRIAKVMDEARQQAPGKDVMLRIVLEGRGPVHRNLQHMKWLEELVAELREEEVARVQPAQHARSIYLAQESHISLNLKDGHDLDGEGIVWLESIDDQTGNDLDMQLLLQEQSFIGDVLRYAQGLRENEQEMTSFTTDVLAHLKDLPTALLKQMQLEEKFARYLHTAEQLAIDCLVKDEGGEE